MATRRKQQQAEEAQLRNLDVTPEDTKAATVRRSSRNAPVPKRLSYSPESTAPPKKRATRAQTDRHSVNGIKEESDVMDNDLEQSVGYGELSEYEIKRLETIKENKAFLSSINMDQARDDLKQSGRPRPSQRGLMRTPAAKEALPVRKSLRLQKIEADVLTLPPEPRDTHTQAEYVMPKKPAGPLPMVPVNMEEGCELPSQLVDICSEDIEVMKTEMPLKDYCSALKNMKLAEERVAKVVKDRIFSAAFHPSSSSLLVAAGDKWGKVGLWNLDADWGDDGVLLFEPHSRPVACMAFSTTHPSHLLSLSYDGSLRCMDVQKAAFHDVYEQEGLKTFDFMSQCGSTLLVGSWFGEVAMVDRRTPGNSHQSIHTLQSKVVRCVHVHPIEKHYFVAAEDRTVKIYDSRYLKKAATKAVSELHGHTLSVTSAYFSPVTGSRVVTSCMDDHIRIYNTSDVTCDPSLLTSIRHNMQTGRWLSKLSAVWEPKQEECFAVGSLTRPRRLQIFHQNGRLQHSFTDPENLSTVPSVVAFHPSRNALLAGNASGRLHVFSD
ncbi:WD repeat-containing protein 76 [Nelusetta ayraudi]|uniref:WD repeat-containing protein 76 n=1 Tax=Nelusetta ayraudi TaxID=303726 RepID=UPI003F71F707